MTEEHLRAKARGNVLRLLRMHGPLTRREIQRRMSAAQGQYLTDTLAGLIDAGRVVRDGRVYVIPTGEDVCGMSAMSAMSAVSARWFAQVRALSAMSAGSADK